MAEVARDSFVAVLTACGVPPSLYDPAGTAQGMRESWRRYVAGTVQPLAKCLESELSAKMETPIRLDFRQLAAADITGKASAYKSLREAGIDDGEARRLAGLS